jgi:hypothetical protein
MSLQNLDLFACIKESSYEVPTWAARKSAGNVLNESINELRRIVTNTHPGVVIERVGNECLQRDAGQINGRRLAGAMVQHSRKKGNQVRRELLLSSTTARGRQASHHILAMHC